MSTSHRWRPPRQPKPPQWVVLLALALFVAWRLSQVGQAPVAPPPEQGALVEVSRAVDGDTLLLVDGNRVRLLGVDTPETKREGTAVQPWGPEAHEFTRQHVEGRTVRLNFDVERRDKFDRLLAYVFAGDFFLNEELLRAGLGRALLKYPYSESMKRRFRRAEKEARDARRGIWSESAASKR